MAPERQAGVSNKFSHLESVSNCMTVENNQPGTPEHIKKYRKSHKMQAGVSILHYGIANDQKQNPAQPFGYVKSDSNHVSDIFQDQNPGVKKVINEINESNYASKKREPLGRPIIRDYSFPAQTSDPNFQFGLKVKGSEWSAKEVLFPQTGNLQETEENQQRYIFTHKLYEPGQQKDRNYQMPVDKNQHVFGKNFKTQKDGVKDCLKPDNDEDQFPQTVIVVKNQEDFKNFKEEPLGRSKNLGQSNQYVGPNHTYGKNWSAVDDWNTAKCIQEIFQIQIKQLIINYSGETPLQDNLADKNLGQATKFGYRNIPKNGDELRVFGVPTIRNDIKKNSVKSVADPQNYGNEPSGVEVLFPQKYSFQGLDQSDFEMLRSKEEIKDIFASVGCVYKLGKFEAIFQRALQLQNHQSQVSVRAFQYAVQQMHHLD